MNVNEQWSEGRGMQHLSMLDKAGREHRGGGGDLLFACFSVKGLSV